MNAEESRLELETLLTEDLEERERSRLIESFLTNTYDDGYSTGYDDGISDSPSGCGCCL